MATRVGPPVPMTAPLQPAVRAARLERRRWYRRRSTLGFILCVPLFVIIGGLVLYPAVFAVYLSMLNKAQAKFVGFANF